MKLGILAAAVTAGLIAFGPLAAEAEDELVYGSFVPPKHGVNVYGLEPMFEKLQPIAPWRLVPGGQLFSGAATLKSVGGGVADAGLVVTSFTRSELKNSYLIADLIMLGEDGMAMNGAAMETIMMDCPECKADYTGSNTVFLAGYSFDGYSLLCSKEDVGDVADVAGLKVRTTGALGRWAKTLGAVPVNMGSGEMPEALQRGQLDCAMGPVAWLQAYPIEDVIKSIYLYDYGALGGIGAFVMNKDAWSGLDAAQKQAMWDELPNLSARIVVEAYEGDTLRALARAEELGIKVSRRGDDITQAWKAHVQDELQTVVKDGEELGVSNPKAIVDTMVENLEKWRKLVAEAGLPEMVANANPEELDAATEVYAKLLREHIYGKLDPGTY